MAVVKFIQAQSMAIQSSGASIGDTTLILQSFKQIDGTTNILTADLGDKCYGTLEPNNGTQEEAISFTGVTQNANGTATLTGVKSVGFVSPYTETVGLAKSHSGGVTFILSNDAGFYGNILTYVNTSLASGAPFANSTTAGISKLSIDPVSGANPIAVGDNDTRVPSQAQKNYLVSVINTGIPYAAAAGTSSAYTATLASSITSLASGTALNFQIPVTNATGVTLNINALGAKPIRKNYTTTLASGDLISGQITSVVYDGAEFQLTAPVATSPISIAASGQTTKDISANTTTTIAHGLGRLPKLTHVTATLCANSSAAYSTAWATISNGTTSAMSSAIDGGTATTGASSSAFTLYNSVTGANSISGTVSVDATNITITWVVTGAPTGTAQIIYDVIG